MSTPKLPWIDKVELQNVEVRWSWSNFSGRKTEFKEEGQRWMVLVLPEAIARDMLAKGWNVREQEPREEGDDPWWSFEVKISYGIIPPSIYFIKEHPELGVRKMKIEAQDENQIGDIRRDVTDQIDVIVRPSRWEKNGRTGVSAYVEEMFVKLRDSQIAMKYADIPDM